MSNEESNEEQFLKELTALSNKFGLWLTDWDCDNRLTTTDKGAAIASAEYLARRQLGHVKKIEHSGEIEYFKYFSEIGIRLTGYKIVKTNNVEIDND